MSEASRTSSHAAGHAENASDHAASTTGAQCIDVAGGAQRRVTEDRLRLVPITRAEAKEFVAKHHRHHRPSLGDVFSMACAVGDRIVGVAMIGRPVARHLCDGHTLEVTRVATDGHRNACSFLYGAAWRAARALGWSRLVTYTLAEEGGASLRAAGWRTVGEAGGGSWSRKSRPRVDLHPTQSKIRWEVA